MISPSRDPDGEYVAWGYSMVIDPWGEVLQSATEGDEIIVQDLGKCQLKLLVIFRAIF